MGEDESEGTFFSGREAMPLPACLPVDRATMLLGLHAPPPLPGQHSSFPLDDCWQVSLLFPAAAAAAAASVSASAAAAVPPKR